MGEKDGKGMLESIIILLKPHIKIHLPLYEFYKIFLKSGNDNIDSFRFKTLESMYMKSLQKECRNVIL